MRAALLAVAVLAAGCSATADPAAHTPGPAAPTPDRAVRTAGPVVAAADPAVARLALDAGTEVEAVGHPVRTRAGGVFLCRRLYGATYDGPPDNCPLDQRVELDRWPGAAGWTGVRGVWTGRGIRVTGTYQPPEIRPAPKAVPSVPCAAPAGGWPLRAPTEAEDAALDRYLAAHPDDYAGREDVYLNGGHLAGTHPTVTVVGLARGDGADLERVFPANLCTTATPWSRAQLDAYAPVVTRMGTPTRAGYADTYEISLVALTPAGLAAYDELPAGTVRLDVWIRPR